VLAILGTLFIQSVIDHHLLFSILYPYSPFSLIRLYLAAVMIAARHKDTRQTWKYQLYQRISGLSESELKVLESEMLKRLNYNIEVSGQEIYDYGVKALTWQKRVMFRPENP